MSVTRERRGRQLAKASGTPQTTGRRPGLRLKPRYTPFVLLLLPLAVVGVTFAYPLYRQIVMSFEQYGLAQQFGQAPAFIGFANYVTVLTDPEFWEVLVRSLGFCLIVAALTMAVGIGMAVVMQRASNYARIFLSVCLMLVWAMPSIASLTVWQWILDARLGVLNYVLTHVGLPQFKGYSWLSSNPVVFLAIVGVIVLWSSIPLVAITIYAALTQVGDEILEAAGIDGAGFWGTLRYIVLPIIRPMLFLIGTLQVIWDFRVFTQVYVLQQDGGSSTATDVLGTYVYRIGIGQGNYGLASALALIMLAIALLLTWQYMRTLLKQGDIV
ncbi:carbohydrate ABC transporter permease [Arthrobacter dokdonensis]|uniref:carbohydrate ABC transporter permease n=1 Tax=Arthrobacter dokdonellae TaxID=2211210 RepID=UPI000DE5A638|nr:sugar ABC transporter permease [Arthrobacter dokdonellae]